MVNFINNLKKVLLSSLLLIFTLCIPVFGDVITEIGYDDGIGIDLGSYIELNEHIRPTPSGASLSELSFYSSNSSVATIDILDDGTIRVIGHKIGSATINVSNEIFNEPIEVYVVYPRSGSELDFDESIWTPSSIRKSRHCYSYAFNLKASDSRLESHPDSYWFQPGQIANILNYNNVANRDVYDSFYSNPSVYFNNIKDDIRAMLNYPTTKDVFTCLDLRDNLSPTIMDDLGLQDPNNFEAACSPGTYKVVFCVDNNGYMHWYRQDSNGLWSHKDGNDYIVQRDLEGKLIFDPRTCASNYTYIGCFEAEAWQ